eukprot:5200235-Lingulodinium_polyedra.AAC.1
MVACAAPTKSSPRGLSSLPLGQPSVLPSSCWQCLGRRPWQGLTPLPMRDLPEWASFLALHECHPKLLNT